MLRDAPQLRILIIDDDLPSVAMLKDALLALPEATDCREAYSLAEADEIIKDFEPDLIFLDMEFPKSNGLDWYENANLPDTTKVVFYTAYKRYIHDALSARVFDFLLKPFDSNELSIILHRMENEKSEMLTEKYNTRQALPATKHQRSIAITTITNAKVIVPPGGILYFRYDSDRKLWECVLTSLRRFILKRQSTAETILDYGDDFVRTHKKYIINVNYLGIIEGNDCILLPPFDKIKEIKISKSYRRDLLDRFYDI